ncbi:MAG TPA: tRNA 5-methoxyuridine(34)/uridine 5-oxyacetic acid(34) synthase CmoB [Mariprofundaceae bacterium]|nr:tRNA 5-methoxyuridine(34)/uridine 5-oxyacetic acid(34) synthase CmoB [Mariprofundaceae bacterium]
MTSMELYQQEEQTRLLNSLNTSVLLPFQNELMELYKKGWKKILKHGDLDRWSSGLLGLPNVTPSSVDLNSDAVRIGYAEDTDLSPFEIEILLKKMHPWRKGPFDIFGVHIDTEWHSDWKWNRIKDHIAPLEGRTILDVGCGSGYHMWRMLGAGARQVIGIDPTPLFSMHFTTVKRYQPEANAFILPVGIDDMPEEMGCFDTVFSMGILYHRRSPLDHLIQLKKLMHPGGELVLETLVIEGDEHACLIPDRRYAKMRNVFFIPSVKMLKIWLWRCGFNHIQCVDVNTTTLDEQRATEWMTFESLHDFLDAHDRSKTVEGYPAPIRATLIAKATDE